MRHCYLCDDSITGSGYRRSVGTGRSQRLSVGKRISTSSTQRTGLRTLCSACAGQIDADARLRSRVGGGLVILLVGVVILANIGGKETVQRTDEPATSASLAPTDASVNAATIETQQESSNEPPLPGSTAVPNSGIGAAAGQAQSAMPSLPSWTSAAALHWKHVTTQGTRWSVRQLRGGRMALLIDLGDDQVATVVVTPKFLRLDAATMESRVEYVKSTVEKISSNSAAYFYAPDGTVSSYR